MDKRCFVTGWLLGLGLICGWAGASGCKSEDSGSAPQAADAEQESAGVAPAAVEAPVERPLERAADRPREPERAARQPDRPAPAAELALPEVDTSGLAIALSMKLGAARREARREPDSVQKIFALGALYLAHGFPAAAAVCFQRATELAPTDFAWWYYLARAHDQAGNAAQAITMYEKTLATQAAYVKEHPEEAQKPYWPARVRLAALLVDQEPQRAAELFRSALEVEPENPAAQFGLGLCAKALGHTDEALESFRAALRVMPDYGPAHHALAEILAAQGKADEAARHRYQATEHEEVMLTADPLEVVLLRVGLDLEALFKAATTQLERRNFAEAERLVQLAMEIDGTGVRARNEYGKMLGLQAKIDDAIREFRAVLAQQPDFTGAQVNLASALTVQKSYDEAEQLLRGVLDREPAHIGALKRFCELAAAREDPEQARPLLTRALEHAPQHAVLHYRVGEQMLRLGHEAEGVAALRRALELEPQLVAAHHVLAGVLKGNGDMAGAQREWTAAVQAIPDYMPARIELIRLLQDQKEYPEMVAQLREGLQHAPKSLELVNLLAWTLATCPDASQRNGTEAVEWGEQAAELTGYRSHQILDTLAAAFAAAGRFYDARDTMTKALGLAEAERQRAERAEKADLAAVLVRLITEYQERQALYAEDKPYFRAE